MTKRTALFLALALLPISCQPGRPPTPAAAPADWDRNDAGPAMPSDDLALLVGKWSIVRAVADGEGYTGTYRSAKFEIAAGGKYTFAMPGLVEESGAITLDPKKNPKEMNLMAEGQTMNRLQPSIDILQNALGEGRKSGDRPKNQVQSAIYKLDGDDLTICLSMLEGKRPTEFETNADSWRVLLKYKRKNPADEQKPKIVPVPSSEAPQLVPQDVRQAWMNAGAEVGWQGMKDFLVLDFKIMPEGLVGVVPAFRFKVWKADTVGKLPAPNVPFGLDILGTDATDADLKELATLESLHTLDLAFTKVTDDGLKHLSRLKSLHVLCLFATKVTDLGLSELASLKSLDTLDLRS